jgi:hypothetical protein
MGPLLFLLLQVALATAEVDDYTGHQILRLIPEKQHHLDFLNGIMTRDTGMNLDFWTEPRGAGHPVDIQIPPQYIAYLKEMFNESDLKYYTMIEDLQTLINDHMDKNRAAKAQKTDPRNINDDYLTFDEMMQWVDDIGAECGSRCEVIDIGNSYEGNVIKLIKITDGSGSNDKQIAWIDSGIHAREWISLAVNLYLIDQMVKGLDDNPIVQQMISTHDWYFLPCVNPDGYIYTHTTNRNWRKTRVPNEGSTCVGADANRNFDHNFGGVGTSPNPCTETFHGDYAYSQPCTAAVSSFIEGFGDESMRSIFVTMHSYSQLWMSPWGYTSDLPPNYDDLYAVGVAATDALRDVYGTSFRVGSASNILYPSSGTSRDWAYGVPEFEYVYTLELRDEGQYGFFLPPEQILPSQVETWVAITTMYESIMGLKH